MAAVSYEAVVVAMHALDPSVEEGKMFGMPVLKVHSKAFAGLYGPDMSFKLAPDEVQSALELPSAHLFDPMGGRPMREWVQVAASDSAEWPRLAGLALHYVASLKK